MKLHKKILIALTTVALLIPTSCSDDFLYVEPYDSVTNDLVFYSVDDFNVALAGVYSGLRSASYYGKNFTVLPDLMTDNTYAKAGFTNSYGYPHTWIIQPGDGEYEGVFSAAYRVIVRASNIIQKAEGFVPTPNTLEENLRLKQIVGEAHLARAMAHFDLVRAFGPRYNAASAAVDLGVPVVTVGEVQTPSRNTVAEVYTQIFADITQAKSKMADTLSIHQFTPSVANALLSRIYLTRGEWSDAASFADSVLNKTTSYSLLNTAASLKNFYDTDGLGSAGSKEIIFHLVIANTTEIPASIGTEYIGSQPGIRIAPNYLVTPEFANTFDRFNDIRFTSQLMKANVLLATPSASGGIVCQKYIGNTALSFQRGANSAKVFRIAEMYLNKAEAHAMLGEDIAARAAIASLLTARIIGFNAASLDALSGQALIDFIRLERRKELAFEGHHWFDLKRWNLGFTRNSNNLANFPNPLTIDATDYRWQWPIPQHEIDANPNMRQNLGYY